MLGDEPGKAPYANNGGVSGASGGMVGGGGHSGRNSGGVNGANGGAGNGGGGAGASGGSVSDGASGVAGLHGGASSGGSSSGEATSGGMDASGSSSEPEPACVGPSTLTRPPATPGPSEQEFNCCVNKVSSAIQNWSSPEGQELMGSEPIVDCCRAIVTAVDVDHTLYNAAMRVRTPCCSAHVAELTELYQHQFCAPWGPPMPPGLDWQAA